MTQQPLPLRKVDGAETPTRTVTAPLMQIGYWLFLLLAIVISGDLFLVFSGTITPSEARDLFLVMGLPFIPLFGVVVGSIIRRSTTRP